MSQATTIDFVIGDCKVACPPVPPSSLDDAYYLSDSDEDSFSKKSHPDTNQDGAWKTSFKDALTKTRNWMAHTFSWRSVKAFFETASTKTGNFLSRIFCQKNVMNAVAYHEKKAHDIGVASRTASHNIYEQVTAPRDVTIPTTYTTKKYSGGNRTTRAWAAKKAKTVLLAAAAAARVLWATGKMSFDIAISAVEIGGAGVLYSINQICDEE